MVVITAVVALIPHPVEVSLVFCYELSFRVC
jgi:hypothetical protein